MKLTPSHVVTRPLDWRPPRSSQGMAMVVVLMLLLAITGITLYSARYAVVGESASRNQLDSEVARQAAEAALRDAERDLLLTANASGARCNREDFGASRFTAEYFVLTCKGGQCIARPDTVTRDWRDPDTAEHWWPEAQGGIWNNDQSTKPRMTVGVNCDFEGGVPLGTYTGAAQMVGVAVQPEYLLELMTRGDSRFFRITARGFGLTTDAQVVLQSYFEPGRPGAPSNPIPVPLLYTSTPLSNPSIIAL